MSQLSGRIERLPCKGWVLRLLGVSPHLSSTCCTKIKRQEQLSYINKCHPCSIFLFPLHGCYRQALPDQPDLLFLPVTHRTVEMAKKSSSRKSLKSLFSRSEAKLDESVEKDADKNGGEKKRFKFLKFKIKSKGSSASEKSTSQQVSR